MTRRAMKSAASGSKKSNAKPSIFTLHRAQLMLLVVVEVTEVPEGSSSLTNVLLSLVYF